jgi:glycogen synthase
LVEFGYDVHVLGIGAAPTIPGASFHSLGSAPTRLAHWRRVLFQQAPARFGGAAAEWLAAHAEINRACLHILQTIAPAVVHANDWPTLWAATELKRTMGAKVIYDSHEFASEEHGERASWRLLTRPYVQWLEGSRVDKVDQVITVGPGIARALQALYRTVRPPQVILNVPNVAPAPFRPAASPLEMLYHGLMKPGRGLETLIDAMALIERPARLVLRGMGKPSYVASLQRRARGAGKRVVFESAVPAGEVVSAASRSDIGLFLPPPISSQNQFTLPNKLFEYIAAGLMVVSSDVEDMAAIVRGADCGIIVAGPAPQDLAQAVNGLAQENVSQYKMRASHAARVYNWSSEKEKLRAVYASLQGA